MHMHAYRYKHIFRCIYTYVHFSLFFWRLEAGRWFLKTWNDIPLAVGNKQSSPFSDDIPRPRPSQWKEHLIQRGDFFFLCISGSLSVLAEWDPSDVLVVLNGKLCYIHICVNIWTIHGEILARYVYASNCRIN